VKKEREKSRIRSLREKWGYTQTELAEELNAELSTRYTKSAISKWETFKTKPPREVLEKIEYMFGVREGYLLEVYGYLEEAVARRTASLRLTTSEFQVGVMRVPVVRIIGGNGRVRYTHPDGIQAVFHNRSFRPPQDILDNFNWLLRQRREESGRAIFQQRNMVRLDDYEMGLSEPYDEPYPLKIHVSLTDFETMMVTNRSLDTKLPGSTLTLRDIYAKDPTDFAGSELANPLAINLSLVTTKDRKIYVARRGSKVATNPGNFGPAVSGTANPLFDFETPGKYNPFLTAQREAFEEVTQPYRPEFSEFVFFGLARTLTFYFPFLFGELRLIASEEDIRSLMPQDNWDITGLVGIPFTIDAVTSFIKKLYRYMVENQDFYPATTIFSLYQSLIYEYPDEWKKMKKVFEEM
jgi:transcriptional regulator with XRE-family HTH domain